MGRPASPAPSPLLASPSVALALSFSLSSHPSSRRCAGPRVSSSRAAAPGLGSGQMVGDEWWVVSGGWWVVSGGWWVVSGEWWVVGGEW